MEKMKPIPIDYNVHFTHIFILVFLSIRLLKKYMKLLQYYSEYEQKPVDQKLSPLTLISKSDICNYIWNFLPKDCCDSFINLYIHCGQLFACSKNQFFSPHSFPSLPADILFDQYPSWHVDDTHYITRCFSFESLNDSLFCKLVHFIHRLVLDFNVPQQRLYLRKLYQYALDVELVEISKTNEGEVEKIINYGRILFDYSRCCITLYAGSPVRHQLFCILAEGLEGLFHSDPSFQRSEEPVYVCFAFFNGIVIFLWVFFNFALFEQAMCVCSVCRSESSRLASPLWIPLSWIDAVARSGTAFLYCGDRAVRLALVAPGNFSFLFLSS